MITGLGVSVIIAGSNASSTLVWYGLIIRGCAGDALGCVGRFSGRAALGILWVGGQGSTLPWRSGRSSIRSRFGVFSVWYGGLLEGRGFAVVVVVEVNSGSHLSSTLT